MGSQPVTVADRAPRWSARPLATRVCVVCAVVWSIGAGEPVQTPKPGVVRGQVRSAATGNGLRQAEITLTDAKTRATFRAASDRQGRYEVLDVPPGRYVLSASRRGYVASEYRQPTRRGRMFEVRSGEVLERVDVSLPKGGVIVGRVIDEGGEPVIGASVQARRYWYLPSGRRALSVEGSLGEQGETTDDVGEFRLFGLTPGQYVVSASPDGRGVVGLPDRRDPRPIPAEDGYATTFAPGTPHIHEAQMVSVAANETTQVGIAMTSASIVSISGSVHDADGVAVAKGSVSLHSADATRELGPIAQMPLSSNGSFVFANLVAGDYVIDVKGTRVGEAKRVSVVECAAAPVSTGNQPIQVSITTSRASAFSGRVRFEGRVPQTPVELVAVPEDVAKDDMSVWRPDGATVKADGSFRMEGVCGRVVFRAPGLPQPWMLTSVVVNGTEVVDVGIDARKGPAASVDVVISDKSGTVTGYGKSADGEPVDDFVVLMFPAAESSDTISLRYMHAATADPEGRYQLSRIPAGRYVIAAVEKVEEGSEWNPELRNRLRAVAQTVTVGEGEALRLDLRVIR
jgi:hypothetical protein